MTTDLPAAMPSPMRQARRSVVQLTGMGYTRREAATIVMAVCDIATLRFRRKHPGADPDWLAAVCAEARHIRDTSH